MFTYLNTMAFSLCLIPWAIMHPAEVRKLIRKVTSSRSVENVHISDMYVFFFERRFQ